MTAAVIFDCDGTLVDTERALEAAYVGMLGQRGRELSLEVRRSLLGSTQPGAARLLAEEYALEEDEEALAAELEARILASLPALARPLPGAEYLLARLGDRPRAVASNSSRGIVEATLRVSGLARYLAVLSCASDGLEAKPAPDLYLNACEQLAVAPGEAIAIEDSPRGVEAARRAGIRVVGIASLPGLVLDADVTAGALDDDVVLALLGVVGFQP